MNRQREITWKQFAWQLLILCALLVATFPRVFFYGELLSSADLLFLLPPWSHYAPENFEQPQNQLMFDPVMAFRPDYLLTQQSLRNGEWPVWNPWEYGGVPLLANCQSTVFYPIRLLLLVTDVDTAMTAWVILKLLLCGITGFIGARLLGLGLAASRFFSVAWMLNSYNLIWANWPLVDVSAWVPILFAGAEFIINERYRRGFCLMALGGTLILYAGHPETAFTMSLGIGVYFLIRLLIREHVRLPRTAGIGATLSAAIQPLLSSLASKRTWKSAIIALTAWALALFVYLPQLLPFVEFLTHSYTFNERHEKELTIEFRAGGAASMFVPRFFGTNAEDNFWDQEKWNSNIMGKQYPGMIIWCAIALLLVKVPPGSPLRRRNKLIIALFASSALMFLLAYHVWPIGILHDLPVFSSMLEVYHICFALFAMPLLGTIAIERWLSCPRGIRDLYPLAILIAIIGAVVGATYAFNVEYLRMLTRKEMPGLYEYIVRQIAIGAVFLGASALLLAVAGRARRLAVAWSLLAMLFVADHWVATHGLNPTLPRSQAYPKTELTTFLASLPKPTRVGVSQANVYSGSIANYGVEEWLGYDGLFPERVIRYQHDLKDSVWKAMEPAHSIQYYLNDPDPRFEPTFPYKTMLEQGRLEKVGVFDIPNEAQRIRAEKDQSRAIAANGIEVYRNIGAFPRAYLVGKLEIIPDRDELLETLMTPGFNPAKLAYTEVTPSSPLPNATAEHVGDAKIEDWNFTSARVSYTATERAVLILADAIYPGWNSYLDGEKVELFPVFYMFRGVIVPEGTHTVEYRYEPVPLEIGIVISALVLVASALACIVWLRRHRTVI